MSCSDVQPQNLMHAELELPSICSIEFKGASFLSFPLSVLNLGSESKYEDMSLDNLPTFREVQAFVMTYAGDNAEGDGNKFLSTVCTQYTNSL